MIAYAKTNEQADEHHDQVKTIGASARDDVPFIQGHTNKEKAERIQQPPADEVSGLEALGHGCVGNDCLNISFLQRSSCFFHLGLCFQCCVWRSGHHPCMQLGILFIVQFYTLRFQLQSFLALHPFLMVGIPLIGGSSNQ